MKFCGIVTKENQGKNKQTWRIISAQFCRRNVGKFMIQKGIFGHEIIGILNFFHDRNVSFDELNRLHQ